MSGRRHGTRSGWSALVLVGMMMVLAAPVTGCATLRYALTFPGHALSLLELARIEGRIDTAAPADGPLVVLLTRPLETEGRPSVGVDTFVRSGPGHFAFAVTPGRYNLSAYEDRNQNGRIDPGEPTWPKRGVAPLEVGPAQAKSQDIVLDSHATARRGELSLRVSHRVAQAPRRQAVAFSPWAGSPRGTICPDLGDERFGHENAVRGLWRPMDFLREGLAGVYLLARYDSARVPVLFVHGIAGHRDSSPPWRAR